MINAIDSLIGQKYKTASGILVEVVEKGQQGVLVKSFETGHSVPVPPTYKLIPVIDTEVVKEKSMSNEATTVPTAAAPKTRKLKKSNIVDDGLRASLSVDEITKNVLTSFPETPEKSVRNLISVRRSKLKKTV